jgi:transcriptional regulator with XRE-family HTH domain
VDYRPQCHEIGGVTTKPPAAIGVLFGEVLFRHRSTAGISQEELALRADVDRTFVSRLERGVRQPTITTLIVIAQALGVHAADLVRETEAALHRKR